jgi:UDP-glucose 4-epimerase
MVLNQVMLTGASGMLGQHIVKALDAAGIATHCTSRAVPATCNSHAWTVWDLNEWRDCDALERSFGRPDVIVHCGAPVPRAPGAIPLQQLFDATVRSSLCLAEWARRRAIGFIYISGAIVYQEPDRTNILEDDALGCWTPWWDYSLVKLLAEQSLESERTLGLKLCVLRPSSIYGAGLAEHKTLTRFLRSAARGETLELRPPYGDRTNLVHAADVADAVVTAAQLKIEGTFNIAGSHAPTIVDIARACIEVVGQGDVQYSGTHAESPGVHRFGLDCTRALQAFGYKPRRNLHDGISQVWSSLQGVDAE